MILWRGRENESELSVQNCPCFWPVLNIQDVIMLSTIPNTQLHYFKAFLCRDSVFPPPNRKAACLNIKTKRIIKNKDILKRSSPCILYSTLDEAGALSETSSVSATSKCIFAYIISRNTHTHAPSEHSHTSRRGRAGELHRDKQLRTRKQRTRLTYQLKVSRRTLLHYSSSRPLFAWEITLV